MTNELSRLVERGALQLGEELYHPRGRRSGGGEVTAYIVENGVDVAGQIYPSLSTAAKAVAGTPTNGWTYWRLRRSDQPLAEVRKTTDNVAAPGLD
jgi:hypothetical protein